MCGVQVHTIYGIIMPVVLQSVMHKNSERLKYQLTSAMWSKICYIQSFYIGTRKWGCLVYRKHAIIRCHSL